MKKRTTNFYQKYPIIMNYKKTLIDKNLCPSRFASKRSDFSEIRPSIYSSSQYFQNIVT